MSFFSKSVRWKMTYLVQISMSKHTFIAFWLFLAFAAASSEKSGKIFYTVGEILRVHQWYFLEASKNESIESIAHYLARNGQFTTLSNEFDLDSCKIHGTVIVTEMPFLWILQIIQV